MIYAADTNDETAVYADWVVPVAHPLEAWGDVRGVDGTYGVCQPIIAPLLGGLSLIEIVSILANFEEVDPLKIVQKTAAELTGGSINERTWKELLLLVSWLILQPSQSVRRFSTEKPAPSAVPGIENAKNAKVELDVDSVNANAIEVVIHPSDSVYDGRLANNGWLQELPQPITKLTWDNAALMSNKTARKLKVAQGELVRLKQGEASVEVPAFIVLGHAEGSITLNLGYGRTRAGAVGGMRKSAKEGFTVGTNLASLRRWNQHSILTGVTVSGTSKPYKLATTQDHFAIEDQGGMREIAKRSPMLIAKVLSTSSTRIKSLLTSNCTISLNRYGRNQPSTPIMHGQ